MTSVEVRELISEIVSEIFDLIDKKVYEGDPDGRIEVAISVKNEIIKILETFLV